MSDTDCAARNALYMREWGRKNPDKVKNNDLKKHFGITLSRYNEIWEEQGGVCAICKQTETIVDNRTKKPRSLAVDHNHNTDEVRGLLCMACNQGLGNFKENPELMRLAAIYINERGSKLDAPPSVNDYLE